MIKIFTSENHFLINLGLRTGRNVRLSPTSTQNKLSDINKTYSLNHLLLRLNSKHTNAKADDSNVYRYQKWADVSAMSAYLSSGVNNATISLNGTNKVGPCLLAAIQWMIVNVCGKSTVFPSTCQPNKK